MNEPIVLGPQQTAVFRCFVRAASAGRSVSNPEIAAELEMSEGTVKTHVRRLCGKFGVRDRTELLLLFADETPEVEAK